ncbi:uncharacterized protein FA14DRAFT_177784 [Meira miltonrushii]|uniref:Uncharacterized protein n=1 Tax=Meira miltonrushii TaxID=1280837 RepID=A0A316VSM6_9BASI|nr:uncharacterized protein FA14DRAFT_177784 [Meira miltonrushii]PWN38515.1 hypothetical protein FA14DRAFT_177784 [Meira miltonrushii]
MHSCNYDICFHALLLFGFFVGLLLSVSAMDRYDLIIKDEQHYQTFNVPSSVVTLAKRQVSPDAPDTSPMFRTEKRTRKRKEPSLLKHDHAALKAVSMFFKNDHVSLEQAMARHNVPKKGNIIADAHTSSVHIYTPNRASHHVSGGEDHDAATDIAPFSHEVLRNSHGRKPAGYDGKKQLTARAAEKYIIDGTATDDKNALELAKSKIAQKYRKKGTLLATWREIARTDPSKAREMKTQAPRRLKSEDYIPLRAHQLHHQRKVASLEIGVQMAKEENERELSRKRNNRLIAKSRPKKL